MKFYGHANLQQNQLQNAVLPSSTTFPLTPAVGQVAFVNSIVYICISTADSLPVWVPMTREITSYTHTQDSAAQVWTINHNLNTTSVSVQVYGTDNKVVIPDEIETVSNTQVKVTMNLATQGRAVLVSGHIDGNTRPTYAYTHYQSVAASSWVITHNLGYNPIVRVFIGTQEVQPLSIVHDNTNQVTITFSSPKVGYARLL